MPLTWPRKVNELLLGGPCCCCCRACCMPCAEPVRGRPAMEWKPLPGGVPSGVPPADTLPPCSRLCMGHTTRQRQLLDRNSRCRASEHSCCDLFGVIKVHCC